MVAVYFGVEAVAHMLYCAPCPTRCASIFVDEADVHERRSNLSGHQPRSWILFFLMNLGLVVPTLGGTYFQSCETSRSSGLQSLVFAHLFDSLARSLFLFPNRRGIVGRVRIKYEIAQCWIDILKTQPFLTPPLQRKWRSRVAPSSKDGRLESIRSFWW